MSTRVDLVIPTDALRNKRSLSVDVVCIVIWKKAKTATRNKTAVVLVRTYCSPLFALTQYLTRVFIYFITMSARSRTHLL